MEKVNGCPKDIGLKNIFKNILLKKKKKIDFLWFFLYSHECNVKTFFKQFTNNWHKNTF